MRRDELTRREFLAWGGRAALALGLPSWAASAPRRGKCVVALLLSGGVDALSLLAPCEDPFYRALRPTLALPPPGREGGALPLDGGFGLHPSLAPLLPLYRDGLLSFAVATGTADESRSHADALQRLAAGAPSPRECPDGWANRAAAALGSAEPLAAVAIGRAVPRVLRGAAPVATFERADEWRGADLAWPFPGREGLDALLGLSASRLLAAQTALEKAGPAGREEYPDAPLGRDLRELARVLKARLGTVLGFVEAPGWDDHAGMAAALPPRLDVLARSLAAFFRDLGPLAADVSLVTLTEFGRALEENGSGGADHGHASLTLAAGGAVKGGRVVGRWPGLAPEARFQGRDLAATTDLRGALGEVLRAQLGLADLSAVFPGGSWRGPGLA